MTPHRLRTNITTRLGTCVCLAAMVALVPSVSFGQSLPQFRIGAEVKALRGGVPGANDLVSVRITYADPATGLPSRQPVRPIGFFRVAGAAAGDCAAAVRSFSLNRGMHRGATSLTGSLIVTANADATLSFVDPLSSLASANIFDLAQLEAVPVAVLPFQGSIAALLPDGRIVLADAGGDMRQIAQVGTPFVAIGAAGPALWAAGRYRLEAFDHDGVRLFSQPVQEGVLQVAALASDHASLKPPDRLAVLDSLGSIRFVSPYDGSAAGETVAVAARRMDANASAVIAASNSSTIRLLWPGNGAGRELDAGFVPDGIKADRLGLFAFAWRGTDAVLIDLRRGMIADRLVLPAEPADVLFSGRSLFLNHKADSNITLIDTGPVSSTTGKAALRTYKIEARESGPTPLAVHNPDQGLAVALPRGQSTANIYGNGNPTAPITTTPLRGARPLAITMLDRSFRSVGTGGFEAFGRLPSKGPVELVTLTDDFKTIKCFPIKSSAPLPDVAPEVAITTSAPAQAGKNFTAVVTIRGDLSRVAETLNALPLTVRDIHGNRKSFEAQRRGEAFAFDLNVKSAGQYPVSVELPGFTAPGFIEVMP